MIGVFYPPGAFLAADFPEPLFLCEPILPAGGIAVFHGPPGAGKTQLAFTFALAVMQGETFLKEYQCKQSSVLLIEADTPRKLLQDRMRLAPAVGNLEVLYTEPYDIVQIVKEWQADRAELPEPLGTAQSRHPGLVIVDTLRYCHNLDEINETSAKLVYGSFHAVFPHTTILFLHHDRKKPTSQWASPHFDEAAAGSIAWKGGADLMIRVDKEHESKEGEHVAQLTFTKHRSSAEPPPMTIRLNPETLLVEPTKPTARQQLYRWLEENPNGTQKDALAYLSGANICKRTMAYRLVKEMASTRV